MNKNILAENMRRFYTKNLNEQPEEMAPKAAGETTKPGPSTPWLIADIERANTDPVLMAAIADWVATRNSVEELQYDLKQLANSNTAAATKIADFFQRNQNNAQISNKQIRQATRKYRASQIDGDKAAQGAGMAGAIGGVLAMTIGGVGKMFLDLFRGNRTVNNI